MLWQIKTVPKPNLTIDVSGWRNIKSKTNEKKKKKRRSCSFMASSRPLHLWENILVVSWWAVHKRALYMMWNIPTCKKWCNWEETPTCCRESPCMSRWKRSVETSFIARHKTRHDLILRAALQGAESGTVSDVGEVHFPAASSGRAPTRYTEA